MTNRSFIDYLIIGNGIAGSLLAWHLIERGYRIRVIYDASSPGCSSIAAGILNTITGKRVSKAWQADQALKEAKDCYRQLESFFNTQLFKPYDIIRLYQSDEEKEIVQRRRNDNTYHEFLKANHAPHSFPKLLHDPLGSFKIDQGGVVNVEALLGHLTRFFLSKNCIINQHFDYQQLTIGAESVIWENIEAKKIIFCEGWQAIHNPWFSGLPFQLTHGEILSLAIPQAHHYQHLISKGFWLIPHSEQIIRFGATYDRRNLANVPTQAGLELLLNGYRAMVCTDEPYEVTDHQAGIRPGTWDTLPFVGLHPKYPQLGIFNGFGSKGTLLIPPCSKQFVDFLHKGTPLAREIDIKRFFEH